jgi:hypothetical protein
VIAPEGNRDLSGICHRKPHKQDHCSTKTYEAKVGYSPRTMTLVAVLVGVFRHGSSSLLPHGYHVTFP